jgi:aspartate 4-decarboxylase
MYNTEHFKEMSPFEIRLELLKVAQKNAKNKKIYNVSRGNPNFFNTLPRLAFNLLLDFSLKEGEKKSPSIDLGFNLHKKSIAHRFILFLKKKKKNQQALFLLKSINYVKSKLKIDLDTFVFDLCEGALGISYPQPSRIYPSFETIIKKHLSQELYIRPNIAQKMQLFATEGATGAMLYVFNSLKINHLLNTKDSIAIVTPIFSPYLEYPVLKDYNLKIIRLEAQETLGWQLPDHEIEKLKNKKIKALFVVNPGNPTCVTLNQETLNKIVSLVKTVRKDLIIITDTVYAPFVKHFESFENLLPHQTIGIYSYSKLYGATGLRLGMIMLHQNNILDKKIRSLSLALQNELHKRYKTITYSTDPIPFIDRISMDSKQPPLAHTSGLSGIGQVMETLFSLYDLLDEKKAYKKTISSLLQQRFSLLYQSLQMPMPKLENQTYYYALLNILEIAEYHFGNKFHQYLSQIDPMEFLFKLAQEYQVVCLPGKGFGCNPWTFRVSLANIPTLDYSRAGKSIFQLLLKYYLKFKNS